MNFAKIFTTTILILLHTAVSAKTFDEYRREAEAKTPICQHYSKERKRLRETPKSFADSISGALAGEKILTTEQRIERDKQNSAYLDKLATQCNIQARTLLSPEAIAVGKEEERKREEYLEYRQTWQYWFKETLPLKIKSSVSEFFKDLGMILIWPLIFITLFLGLILIFQPRMFASLMASGAGGIIRLFIKPEATQASIADVPASQKSTLFSIKNILIFFTVAFLVSLFV